MKRIYQSILEDHSQRYQQAKKIRVSDNTIRRWVDVLETFHYCFLIRPWTKNVTRSLLKEPKAYLWDWSGIEDKGAKIENFVACHLLKAVHCWTDLGFEKLLRLDRVCCIYNYAAEFFCSYSLVNIVVGEVCSIKKWRAIFCGCHSFIGM